MLASVAIGSLYVDENLSFRGRVPKRPEGFPPPAESSRSQFTAGVGKDITDDLGINQTDGELTGSQVG